MKKYFCILFLLPLFSFAADFSSNAHYEVCFTLSENCVAKIVKAIDDAKSTIRVQAFSFTSHPIANALVAAKLRGVDVEVILDNSKLEESHKTVAALEKAKIPTWVDSPVGIAHNKVMIFDGKRVETGSFNYTASAEKDNAENVLIISDAGLAQAYSDNWNARKNLSRPLIGK